MGFEKTTKKTNFKLSQNNLFTSMIPNLYRFMKRASNDEITAKRRRRNPLVFLLLSFFGALFGGNEPMDLVSSFIITKSHFQPIYTHTPIFFLIFIITPPYRLFNYPNLIRCMSKFHWGPKRGPQIFS